MRTGSGLCAAIMLLGIPATCAEAGGALQSPVSDFLQAHCVTCHDATTSSGGLDLTALRFQLDDPANFQRWVEIHDRVNRGEMPPPDEVDVPPEGQRKGMVAVLARELTTADLKRQRAGGRVAMRRLNRSEYENTMRDLFEMPGLQVKDLLPEDGRYDGFDKTGSALDLSAVQLRRYLEAADFVLDEAMAHEARPMVFRHRFRRIGGLAQFFEATFPMYEGKVDLELIDRAYPRPGQGKALHLIDRLPFLQEMDSLGILTHARPSWNAEVENFSPFHSGLYRIRTSLWSFHLKDGEVLPTDRRQSFALTANGRLLDYFDAPSMEPQEHEVVVWLNEAETLQLNPANLWGNFNRAYNHDGPAVAVDYVDIEGPLHDSWPPASHRRLFGDLPLARIPFERDREYPRQPVKPKRKPGYRPNHVDGPESARFCQRPGDKAGRFGDRFRPAAARTVFHGDPRTGAAVRAVGSLGTQAEAAGCVARAA